MTNPIKIITKKEFEKTYKKPDQEEIWDSIANPWKTYVVKEIPIVKEFLLDKSGLVIDLGCGNGRNIIANKSIKYYGVDFSSGQLKHAEFFIKKRKINAQLIKSKADKLDSHIFKSEMFDFGLFIATLHCLLTPEKRLSALKEFYRVLKPGAVALISVWNSEDNRFKIVKNHGDIYMSWKENNISYMRYYYLFKKQEFFDLIEKAGFKILEFYSTREHDRFSKKNWIVRIRK